MDHVATARQEFARRFGGVPRVFFAPGRVNLIGEHTDYNQGFVMPAAIVFGTWVAIAPRPDNKLVLFSHDFTDGREFDLDDPAPRKHWTDYIRGVALVLKQSGHAITGANIVLHGDVPMGAGLSSSASLEVASALALLTISGRAVPPRELALLCQRAENEFVGARCGIMDQFVSVHGQAGNAVMLDCRSLAYERVAIPHDLALVVCNTMLKHSIAAGEYNTRRAQCEEGVRLLQQEMHSITSLRDVALEDLEVCGKRLPSVIYRRCRHVVAENARVGRAADALRSGDLASVGGLMAASHRSLRDDYEVSCTELDAMVEVASALPGVVGARMTGGGFGGCTINLVHDGALNEFRARAATAYKARTGIEPEIYVSPAAGGATEINAALDSEPRVV